MRLSHKLENRYCKLYGKLLSLQDKDDPFIFSLFIFSEKKRFCIVLCFAYDLRKSKLSEI